MDRKGWNQTQLAQFLGESPVNVNRWSNYTIPHPEKMEEILNKLGGDIERAFPTWDPAQDEAAQKKLARLAKHLPNTELGKLSPRGVNTKRTEGTPNLNLDIPLSGSIDAGTGTMTILREAAAGAPGMAHLFSKHPNNKFCDTSSTPFCLEIEGESMEPKFSPGDWIVVRAIAPNLHPAQLPARFLGGLVLPDTDQATFKYIELIRQDGHVLQIIGHALNKEFPTLTFKPDDAQVKIAYIFIGAFNFGLTL